MIQAAAPAPAAADLWSRAELAELARGYSRLAAAALEPTPDVPLSTWSERNVTLPDDSPVPGELQLRRTPYLAGWLDLYTNPDVTEVTAVTSIQVAKSIGNICLLGYTIKHRRWPAMLVQAKAPTAKSFNRVRVQGVFKASPSLAPLLPDGRGNTDFEVIHTNGIRVRYAGAGSPSDLAEASVPLVIFDEFDKYPRRAGQESDPIELGSGRTLWWNRTLVVKTSTPSVEKGYAWRELSRAPCQMRFYVQCPACGTWQILSFDGEKEGLKRGEEEIFFPGPAGRICWPIDERGHALHTPDEIQELKLAWYECGECKAHWSEKQKAAIIAGGEWRTLDGQPPRGHVGLHIWMAYNPRKGWSDIAAKHLSSEDKPELYQNFVNSWLGRPYRQKGNRPDYEVVVSRRRRDAGGYAWGTVPEGVRFLTAGIDVHKTWQYWMVFGWAAGRTGYLVAAGREDVGVDPDAGWARVFSAVTGPYPVAAEDGALGTIAVGELAGMVLVDSGWQRTHGEQDDEKNEAEVVERCDDWNFRVGGPLFQPSKGGSQRGQFPPLAFNRTLDRDREGKPLHGRLQLHTFNPWFFKKEFYSRLARPTELGGLWLPGEVPEEVMRQLMSEELVTLADGREEWMKRTANHWFDCAVLCLVAAFKDRLFLESAARPAARRPPPRPPQTPGRGTIRTRY